MSFDSRTPGAYNAPKSHGLIDNPLSWFGQPPAPTPRERARPVEVRAAITGLRLRPGGVEVCMDSQMNQLARELTEAISAAVAADARVEACREKARAAGYDMRVSLEAIVGFSSLDKKGARRGIRRTAPAASSRSFEMSANDRRFLKSLRISADEPTEKEVE